MNKVLKVIVMTLWVGSMLKVPVYEKEIETEGKDVKQQVFKESASL